MEKYSTFKSGKTAAKKDIKEGWVTEKMRKSILAKHLKMAVGASKLFVDGYFDEMEKHFGFEIKKGMIVKFYYGSFLANVRTGEMKPAMHLEKVLSVNNDRKTFCVNMMGKRNIKIENIIEVIN